MNSINSTPVSERIQIGFFGATNAGKSSLINAITGQEVSVVSDKKGTTTDPVIKTMELKGLGPVALIDTPGLGDDTEIGELREKRTREMLERSDMIVVVEDVQPFFVSKCKLKSSDQSVSDHTHKKKNDLFQEELNNNKYLKEILEHCKKTNKPCVLVFNKADLPGLSAEIQENLTIDIPFIAVSALQNRGIDKLKELLAETGKDLKNRKKKNRIVSDLLKKGDTVILVIPIDESAPEGRLILPQQQVIRDILDSGGNAVCIRDDELSEFFDKNVYSKNLKPALVITDSQVFKKVSDIVHEDILLTSFSILMARYKGTLKEQVEGAVAIEDIKNGDKLLIAEGCTHHRQCEDIGTVKLPNMLKKYTGADFDIETSSGHGYPDDLKKYRLILHCGGCMLGESEVTSRIRKALDQGIPVVNYGVAIAYMSGILKRSLEPIPEVDITKIIS